MQMTPDQVTAIVDQATEALVRKLGEHGITCALCLGYSARFKDTPDNQAMAQGMAKVDSPTNLPEKHRIGMSVAATTEVVMAAHRLAQTVMQGSVDDAATTAAMN